MQSLFDAHSTPAAQLRAAPLLMPITVKPSSPTVWVIAWLPSDDATSLTRLIAPLLDPADAVSARDDFQAFDQLED